MVIQRANPGLYELLTNGTLQANAYFDKAQLNCQAMSKKLADHTLSGPWVQAAVGEGVSERPEWDERRGEGRSATEQINGNRGRLLGRRQKKRGGKGQAAIRPTHDIAGAGYNILNKQAADSSASISESACNGALCRKYKNGDEAAQVVASVLAIALFAPVNPAMSAPAAGWRTNPAPRRREPASRRCSMRQPRRITRFWSSW